MSSKPKGWYKNITLRPVLPVDGYESYEKICGNVANIYFSTNEEEVRRLVLRKPKESMCITVYTFFKVGQAKCPAYWVGGDLITALMQSNLSVEIEKLNWAMVSGIFMLPLGAILSPENHSITAIYWHYDTDNGLLYWVGVDDLSSYCRRFSIINNENKLIYNDIKELDAGVVVEFNQHLQSIFLRLLLIMECRPEYVETESARVVVNKGFSKKNDKDYYQPLWIGKDYRLKREGKESTSGATGSSKAPHWRRGFLRNQAYGEGYKERKLVWIEPVFVVGGE
ncbi:hypothetical protein DSM106972_097380 [Dulcicalothrix desertica PCC 7102]|uniref:Uncharacterized protein n=1 Tax=Dulcicalothrix desertica PCC 7102 TaxID=232991 RepID=A0A433UH57_9CYAN|nr:hypothetical protein [Dulcicalothrix desertica]RUS93144.1 hypothetical protein DSM106972_097380 [Dulcicalothrix desertica PCC 7102]TWH62795.1 hypothetical protein CAL7102_00323 [Dulcicalothrix desertica PCC 7102]